MTQPKVDLFDPEVQQCPYAAYRTLRDEAPAYRIPGTDMFVVTRHDDVRRVLTDPESFPSSAGDTPYRATTGNIDRAKKVADRFAEHGWVPAPTLAGRDDPNHRQMRAMFNEAFKPSRVKQIDPLVETLAFELIDGFIADGRCDWVRQFAIPLPLFIIGEQMGARREDMWRIKRWTDAFFHRISMMLPEDRELEMVDREIEAQHYFQPIFERLREHPDDSLISVLVNTVIEGWGRPLNDNELHAEMMADTFVGGSETTTNALAAGMKLLIENKDVWQQLKSDPDRYMKTFVEEVVRLESPVQSLMRFCATDTEIGGTTIPAARWSMSASPPPIATSAPSMSPTRSTSTGRAPPRISASARARITALAHRSPGASCIGALPRWSSGSRTCGSSKARTTSPATRISCCAR